MPSGLKPSGQPSSQPSRQPTSQPSTQPSVQPSSNAIGSSFYNSVHGIQLNYPVSNVLSECTPCYVAIYGTATTESDILRCHGPYLFVGARINAGASVFELGAYALASQITTHTALNSPNYFNGAWWYLTSGYSVGFSMSSNITQNSCDTNTNNAAHRLCWHMVRRNHVYFMQRYNYYK
jgi:hypothetical protein